MCVSSGHCELQDLAQEHGVTSVRYPYRFPNLTPDTSHPRYVFDPNRCVLCARCVRTCAEVEGAHVWDIAGRGVANPLALLMSAVMMLNHIADTRGDESCRAAAVRIREAYNQALSDGQKTRDLGGTLDTEEFASAVIALTIYTSAFIAEDIRSGVLSIPKEQMEAARSAGFSYIRSMRFIILPQAVLDLPRLRHICGKPAVRRGGIEPSQLLQDLRGGCVVVPIVDHHCGTRLGEQPCTSRPDTPTGTGDQNLASAEIDHETVSTTMAIP